MKQQMIGLEYLGSQNTKISEKWVKVLIFMPFASGRLCILMRFQDESNSECA
jgi:hypothetical protein